MSSVALYRSLILDPRHGDPAAMGTIAPGLTDAQIATFLEFAARAHNPTFWGRVFPEAMVFYAAHQIERTPNFLSGAEGASVVGPLTNQKDDLLQRGYGQVAGAATASLTDAELMTTSYGTRYLQLRGTRCRAAPFTAPVL